jgi:hypothetical protein
MTVANTLAYHNTKSIMTELFYCITHPAENLQL